jgi:hydrogenase-1 operon protein HyaF
MFPATLPVLGPGSQADEPLATLALPKGMATFERPAFPEGLSGTTEARELLLSFLAALRAWRAGGGAAPRLDLGGLAPGVLAAVAQCLGEGEVSAVVTGAAGSVRIDETAFAGVWNVRALRPDGTLQRHVLEAGPIPDDVRAASADAPRALPIPPEPPGLMNAPAVLREVLAHAAARGAGEPAHVVNLTLLPMTPEDLAYLHGALGTGLVAIHARGYGTCRITGTALGGVWWVQYFNSTGALILDTLEVVDVPEAALAAGEDLDATVGRLAEWVAELAPFDSAGGSAPDHAQGARGDVG